MRLQFTLCFMEPPCSAPLEHAQFFPLPYFLYTSLMLTAKPDAILNLMR